MFQSTLPARGSDRLARTCGCSGSGFNPRSPRGGATYGHRVLEEWRKVSIHAPREGERLFHHAHRTWRWEVSIHAPREGERRYRRSCRCSAWRFNPRSPRGGATIAPPAGCSSLSVSIHAPREGERRISFIHISSMTEFQSTLPARGSDCNIWRSKTPAPPDIALAFAILPQNAPPLWNCSVVKVLFPCEPPGFFVSACGSQALVFIPSGCLPYLPALWHRYARPSPSSCCPRDRTVDCLFPG